MKQSLTFLMLLCCYMLCGAQATSLVVDNQTPGWLSSKINYGDQQTVRNLTVTGYVNLTDLSFIGDLMSKHNLSGHLNLSDVEIVDTKFSSSPGSIGGSLSMFTLDKNASIERFSIPKSLSTISPYLLARIKPDTLDYGSENCKILTKFLITNRYSSTNYCPKVLILRDGVTKIQVLGTDEGNEKNLQTIILPQTIDSICDKALVSCSNLSTVNLPERIHNIGNYAFAGTSFKPDTLHLPSHLKVFHSRSFPKNPGQVIVIPSATEEFDNAEGGDSQLDLYSGIGRNHSYSFIINRQQPPRFRAQYGPQYVDLSSCNLYVPKEGMKLYEDVNYNSSIYGNGGNPYSYATIYPIAVPVKNVILNYSSYNLNVGNSIDIIATVEPINADNPAVIWQSLNNSICQVSQDGRVTGLSSGKSTIKVVSEDNPNIYATCEMVVHQPLQSISLTPTYINLKAGEIYEGLSVSYNPTTADNKNVTWQSSNPSIATVDSNGKITAIIGGETRITVTSKENPLIKAECIVSVIQPVTGISINKPAIELIEEESERLIATITPDNASNKNINWTSSDVGVAMVSPDGTVYAIKPGQATIMATTEDGGFVALCKVTVKAKVIMATAIRLSHTSETIAIGETLQLNAVLEPENVTNSNISWTSTNPNVATVNPTGLIHALAQGSTQIIATTTDGSNLSAICEIIVEKQFIEITQIQISPSRARIPAGKSVKLNAVITPSDAFSTNLLWSSTNTSVATVSQDGNVEAIAEGEAVIIASTQDGSNLSATCNISVYNDIILISEIILNPVNIEGDENESATINAVIIPENATNKQLKWYSSNENVAVVNDGVVKLIKRGTAIITAEALDGSNVKSECTVVVSDSAGIESIIEDKNADVKIFNLSGHLIYQGIYAEANIEPGIYIVLCKGRSFKAKID